VLFVTVLAFFLAELKQSWATRGLGSLEGLTHLKFAKDLTLLAKSKRALKVMLSEITAKLLLAGLKLNPTKCKVQCNVPGAVFADLGEVQWALFEQVPPDKGFKVLGTMWTLVGGTNAEVGARIRLAWRRFYQMRSLLTRDASLKQRLRLLNSVVGGTLMWACESWNTTAAEVRSIRSVWRAMLRKILGAPRQTDEDWVAYVRRSTARAEAAAKRAKVKQWHLQVQTLQWQWAGHVARMGADRWPRRMTMSTKAWEDLPVPVRPVRPRVGRPSKRWKDDIKSFCATLGEPRWWEKAMDRDWWASRSTAFAMR
jgi:hypothetical protein